MQQMKRQNTSNYGKQTIYNNNRFDIVLILILISTDGDEIYNNPNLHSEELEAPDST